MKNKSVPLIEARGWSSSVPVGRRRSTRRSHRLKIHKRNRVSATTCTMYGSELPLQGQAASGGLTVAKRDAAAGEIVGGEFDGHRIPGKILM